MKSRKSYCTTPGVGIGVGIGIGVSKKFNVKVFYVMGKGLSGELSCPCDRSCSGTCRPGPGCSKLTTSLVNASLKFQMLISQIH